MDLGIAPGGILPGSSCTLSFWKSENSDFTRSRSQARESQLLPAHFLGSVYLNCCSTGLLNLLQYLHLKTPTISSGLTSVVLVTVPLMQVNFPNFILFMSLRLATPLAPSLPALKVITYFYLSSVANSLCSLWSLTNSLTN